MSARTEPGRTALNSGHALLCDQARCFIEAEIMPHHAQGKYDGVVPRSKTGKLLRRVLKGRYRPAGAEAG